MAERLPKLRCKTRTSIRRVVTRSACRARKSRPSFDAARASWPTTARANVNEPIGPNTSRHVTQIPSKYSLFLF